MCTALKVKKFEFWRSQFGGNPYFGTHDFCLVKFIFDIYPLHKFDLSSFNGSKVKNFGNPVWGGTLHFDAPKVCQIWSFYNICLL